MNTTLPSKNDLLKVYADIRERVHNTPVLESSSLNQLAGAKMYFKCENFQRMGAFKMRAAVNAILRLSEEEKSRGVVTHSSGNFGQAVALAAKELGVQAYVVMPANAPAVKKAAVASYGGIITECEPTLAAREFEANRIREGVNASFLHPSNDLDVILGNATAAMELLEVVPDLDIIVVPVGGGGLVAGTSLAVNYFGKQCKTIGAEPLMVDDAWRSLQSGNIEINKSAETVADGLRTNLGSVNFPIIRELVSEIIRVEEDEIVSSLKLIWERMKVVVEPSSAVPLAAVLKEQGKFAGSKVGIILSGGNVNLEKLPF